jgi:hydrogenase nickel incorporation protein HypA/HybF
MHEVALMEAVAKSANILAKKRGLDGVREVRILIGNLQQFDEANLKMIFSSLRSGVLMGASLIIGHENAQMKCRVCGNIWDFDKRVHDSDSLETIHLMPELVHEFEACVCGSRDFSVISGRGIYLEGIA